MARSPPRRRLSRSPVSARWRHQAAADVLGDRDDALAGALESASRRPAVRRRGWVESSAPSAARRCVEALVVDLRPGDHLVHQRDRLGVAVHAGHELVAVAAGPVVGAPAAAVRASAATDVRYSQRRAPRAWRGPRTLAEETDLQRDDARRRRWRRPRPGRPDRCPRGGRPPRRAGRGTRSLREPAVHRRADAAGRVRCQVSATSATPPGPRRAGRSTARCTAVEAVGQPVERRRPAPRRPAR